MYWALITLASAFFFGVKDILAKKLFKNNNVTSTQLVFEEYLLILILILAIFFNKVNFNSYFYLWEIYLIKAISIGTSTLLYFRLLEKYEISLVSPILNLSPIILLFLSTLFLSETISSIQLLGILLIIISTYFLKRVISHHDNTNKDLNKNSNKKKVKKIYLFNLFNFKNFNFNFILTSLIMLIAISIAAISDKIILKQVNVYTNMYFTSLIIFFILLIYYLRKNKFRQLVSNTINYPQTIIVSILTIISNFLVLIAIAIPTALITLIIPLRRTSTLFSSLFGGLLFHEKNLKPKLFATFIMLIGILLIVL